ncbi:MAG: stage III sporulation protein AE [Oscillospiraceae bacterium]|jgi:stage III sporulation protein AE|nr:stage III sporulation protein AE [Oscillospiraceae bacterium]
MKKRMKDRSARALVSALSLVIAVMAVTVAASPTAVAARDSEADADKRGGAAMEEILMEEILKEQSDAIGVQRVEQAAPESAGEILGDMRVTDALQVESAIARLVSGVAARLRGIISPALAGAAAVVAAALMSGIFTAAFPEKGGNYARLAAVLAISVVSVSGVNTFIGMGDGVLRDLNMFSKALLPCLAAASAAGGALTSAAVKYSAAVMLLDFSIGAMRTVIMPLIYAYAAVSVAEAVVSAAGAGGASGVDALAGASAMIKWLAKTALTCFVLAFVAYISLTGVIASASDAVTIRAAKVAMSTVLPVVGSILADAADTVMSGAALLRNAVGVFGVLAAAAVCAVPFIRLGMSYMLFKVAGGLSGAAADKSVTKLIDAFGSAFGLTLGMTGSAAVMLFISIVSAIKAVV